jgi:hypothetical protein
MVSRQLELGLGTQSARQPAGRRRRGSGRAEWWFERMRGTVNRAVDWEPAPLPPEGSRPTAVQADSDPSSSRNAPPTSSNGPAAAGVQSDPVEPVRMVPNPEHVTRE